MTALLVWAVRAYRMALAPFFGPCCRFEPSCSTYAEDALRVHGWWRGGAFALARVCRCHPLAKGGLDPIPPAREPERTRGIMLGASP